MEKTIHYDFSWKEKKSLHSLGLMLNLYPVLSLVTEAHSEIRLREGGGGGKAGRDFFCPHLENYFLLRPEFIIGAVHKTFSNIFCIDFFSHSKYCMSY